MSKFSEKMNYYIMILSTYDLYFPNLLDIYKLEINLYSKGLILDQSTKVKHL